MFFEISERVKELSATALKKAETVFGKIDELTEYNQQKVLSVLLLCLLLYVGLLPSGLSHFLPRWLLPW